MKRTTAEANASNLYTEGNPSLGIPATVVGAEEMNNYQEEIVNVVLYAALTLNGADFTQLLQAIKIIQSTGGTQYSMAIANNVSVAANVTPIAVFDKTKIKSGRFFVDLQRAQTGGPAQHANEVGVLWFTHDAVDDVWRCFLVSNDADCGVVFSMTTAGQLQYTSTNYSGTGYTGTLRLTALNTVAI